MDGSFPADLGERTMGQVVGGESACMPKAFCGKAWEGLVVGDFSSSTRQPGAGSLIIGLSWDGFRHAAFD